MTTGYLGRMVLSKLDGKKTPGIIVGVLDGYRYAEEMASRDMNLPIWYRKYPEWEGSPLFLVKYPLPFPNCSLDVFLQEKISQGVSPSNSISEWQRSCFGSESVVIPLEEISFLET